MLKAIKDNRSLTFYQQPEPEYRSAAAPVYTGGAVSAAVANTSLVTATATSGFNTQLNNFLNYFNAARLSDAQTLNLSTANSAARNRGVYRAWEYEKADVLMGGRGSADWNPQESQDIVDHVVFDNQKKSRGGVRGAEGHHQKNAADHPDQQANPDNIKFYRSHEEHRIEGHNGDFKNETDAPMTDKNKMLKRTNTKRVFKNELHGLGAAVAIGAGAGMTIGFVTTLAQAGITPDTLKLAFAGGAKSGIEAGILSAVGYGAGRTVGEAVSQAMAGLLHNIGLNVTENMFKMINMGVGGVLTVAVFSAYQFAVLRRKGMAGRDALIRTGRQALFSLSLLAVSIAAQGIWGGAAGIIVSVGIGIVMIAYSVADSVHQRHFAEKIGIYAIEKCRPSFSM